MSDVLVFFKKKWGSISKMFRRPFEESPFFFLLLFRKGPSSSSSPLFNLIPGGGPIPPPHYNSRVKPCAAAAAGPTDFLFSSKENCYNIPSPHEKKKKNNPPKEKERKFFLFSVHPSSHHLAHDPLYFVCKNRKKNRMFDPLILFTIFFCV